MLTRFSILIVLIMGLVSVSQSNEWKLIWSDEFNKNGLPDTTKWTYEEGFLRNEEQQYYTRERKENARIEKGSLIIEGRKEPFKNPAYNPKSKDWQHNRECAGYTAASLITLSKFSCLYGRIEIKAKLPQGKGVWPALWMMGANINEVGWPRCGEIDIMEFVGHDPNHIYGSTHWGEAWNKVHHTGEKITTPAPYNDFHIYALEWYPDRIGFLFR